MKLITFEDIFSTKVEPPSVILIEGVAGTLKSALCFSLMLDLLKQQENCGLYLTFEQSWTSHIKNMKSLGFPTPENLLCADYNIMRKEFKEKERDIKIFDSILQMVGSLKEEKNEKMKVFVLDSLNAIYSIMDEDAIEFSLVPFFKKLRSQNIISLIIFEKGSKEGSQSLRERFIADGIVSLGILRKRSDVFRYLQPVKFSAGIHSLKKRQLVAGKEGMSLLGSVY